MKQKEKRYERWQKARQNEAWALLLQAAWPKGSLRSGCLIWHVTFFCWLLHIVASSHDPQINSQSQNHEVLQRTVGEQNSTSGLRYRTEISEGTRTHRGGEKGKKPRAQRRNGQQVTIPGSLRNPRAGFGLPCCESAVQREGVPNWHLPFNLS